MNAIFSRFKTAKSTCQGWYRKSAQRLYELLLKPNSTSEDDKRGERILTFILFFIILITIFFEIVLIIKRIKLGSLYDGVPLPFFTGILFVYLFLYFITRKGYYKIAGYIFITAFFCGALFASITWGASLPMGLLAYGLIVTMASIIIGSRFGFIVAIIACLSIIGIGIKEHNAKIVPEWKQETIEVRDVFGYGIMIGLTALLSRLSNKEMEKSLARARISEKALQEERDNLEILVEERTKALRESERERMRELYRFAEFGKLSSGIFHDLLNPLTAVSLSVSQLENSQPGQENSREAVDSIKVAVDATRRMEQFMQAVRKQIKSDGVSENFTLNEEIEDSIELLKFKARKTKVEISFSANEEISYFGNPFKFNQIITNLISNAIDSYSDADFQTSNKHNFQTVLISLSKDNTNIFIHVSDNGAGIDSEKINKVFDPFFSTKDEGLGIGLSTIKGIVEECFNGKIICESQIGIGTKFIVKLPTLNKEERADDKQRPEKNSTGNQERLELS